jgi:hypothetical protein
MYSRDHDHGPTADPETLEIGIWNIREMFEQGDIMIFFLNASRSHTGGCAVQMRGADVAPRITAGWHVRAF